MKERRRGISPIPVAPFQYLNEQQLTGLKVLKEFGWGLVCVRRRAENEPVMILKNCHDKSFGILSEKGRLQSSSGVLIRDPHMFVRHI